MGMTRPIYTKEELQRTYLGKKVHVIITDYHTNSELDAWGTVLKVGECGELYGSWGSSAAYVGQDYISLTD